MIRYVLPGLIFALCPALAAAGPPAPPDTAAFLAEIDRLRNEARIPGLAVAVVRDRSILLAAGLGYANVENRTPVTADTPFNIASVTKPISAVVALQLVESGQLDLDRPIAEYSDWEDFCTRFSAQPSIFARELRCAPADHTLRHLLSHTATGKPGTAFSYNPILYSWASRPIMAVTGTSFSSLVKEQVLEPAGMPNSARKYRDLPLPSRIERALALPYRIDESGDVVRAPLPPPQGDGAAGGVVSSVLDLARFDIALDRDELVSAESRTAMMTPTALDSGDTTPYGLGWYVQEYRGHTLVWHSGWWEDAYSALYLKIPELGVSLILLANSEGVWWGNPLDGAAVEGSAFARAFIASFIGHRPQDGSPAKRN